MERAWVGGSGTPEAGVRRSRFGTTVDHDEQGVARALLLAQVEVAAVQRLDRGGQVRIDRAVLAVDDPQATPQPRPEPGRLKLPGPIRRALDVAATNRLLQRRHRLERLVAV